MGLRNRARYLLTLVGVLYFINSLTTYSYFQKIRSLGMQSPSRFRRSQSASGDEILQDVFNSTLGFEKIFAINLPERTDHRDALILQSSVSGIEVEFVSGVDGKVMAEKALPPGKHDGLGPEHLGAWRGHMNAIAEVVRRNLSSALIFEDDIDWDVRIKPLLKDFAIAVNVLQQSEGDHDFSNLTDHHIAPTSSPYGDDWDVLWPGHCGMKLAGDVNPGTPDKVWHFNDESVPQKQHYKSFNDASPLIMHPHHTRVTLHTHEATCSLAYAVSFRGAQKLLLNLGLQKLDGPFDNMISGWCEGQGWSTSASTSRNCFGVIPSLFGHYRGAGEMSRDSDIDAYEGRRDKSFSENIRYSVRRNLERILDGDGEFEDQYPDG